MKSLYESLLDNEEKIMQQAEEDAHKLDIIAWVDNKRLWPFYPTSSKHNKFSDCIVEIGKDSKGYYIDTEGWIAANNNGRLDDKNYGKYFPHHKDSRVSGAKCPSFRWRKHIKGQIATADELQQLNSIEGLPEEIDTLMFSQGNAVGTKTIDLGDRKINWIRMFNCGRDITLTGNPKVKQITWQGWNGFKPKVTFKVSKMHKQ